jgi:hypothetical protein
MSVLQSVKESSWDFIVMINRPEWQEPGLCVVSGSSEQEVRERYDRLGCEVVFVEKYGRKPA